MAGLSPNIRLQGAPDPTLPDAQDIIVELADNEDVPDIDEKGNIISIKHGDGSVTISMDGRPLSLASSSTETKWFDNLAEKIPEGDLNFITEELLRGIDDDLNSRKDWIDARAQGVKLLGLTIEIPGISGASEGAPVEGMSKVRHPLLLEAVLRFQANARGELLPTDGPVKIRNDDNNADLKEDMLANALEKDLNHYLTSTATEYYPDTDRMLLNLGFGGMTFKKVYFCPLRNRPVSETVDPDDLIVNNAATDLQNAKRVTHKMMMRPSTVKRMQILEVYRDIMLETPNEAKGDALKREEKAQQGISQASTRPEDRDREIYECYCELDVPGFEHKFKGKASGLEIPYRVTIDVTSRQILSIVRNYNEEDKKLPTARATFVPYTFVPGFGFYAIGLLHILGNTTNAITAAWRELLDAGMYANFPGFLVAKNGTRQNTNIFRVPPGGGAQVDTGGMPLKDSIMPLPYQQPSQALMQLVGDIATTGMRIGGTSEQQVGEGRADAPVGTTLALMEQATKVLDSVHKRVHAAQAAEFRLLVECFKENPESFWQRPGRSGHKWDEQTFLYAINNYELVPQADPNTASSGQRAMKIMGLKQLQAANPNLYDPLAIDTAALQVMGWSNPQQFLAPPAAQAAPPPELIKEQGELKVKQQQADAQTLMAQTKAQEAHAKMAQAAQPEPNAPPQPQDTQADMMAAQAKIMDAQTKAKEVQIKGLEAQNENQNRDQDRASKEKIALLDLARDIIAHPEGVATEESQIGTVKKDAED